MATAPEPLPFHLRGNYAPVERELTEHDLPVEGSIPPELRGLFLRNGPNPRQPTNHWFLGDGMVHGIRLEDGRAAWYRNRWVRTRALAEGVSFVSDDGTVDLRVGVANTHVVSHAGRILALVESSFPHELTAKLDTVGPYDFGGKLHTAMTAHPKICPKTGEMHFFGYSFLPPFLTYHRVLASGELVQSEEIPVPGPTMMHDFAITERHVVFLDLPIVFSPELLAEGRMPYAWSDDYGARLGLMPRGGSAADLRWHEIEPCYVFHPMNAHEEGGDVVLDVARYPELWREGPEQFASAFLHRFRIPADAGAVVKEESLDDRACEFPRVDPRREGLANRYGYAVQAEGEAGAADGTQALLRYDLARGAAQTHAFASGCSPGEAVFAPARPDGAEDEGYVLALVYDAARDGSDLVILDASAFEAPPVARVRLPQRVPFGFHGSWIPAPA